MRATKGFGVMEIVLIVVIVGLAALVGWELLGTRQTETRSTASKPTASPMKHLSQGSDNTSLETDMQSITSNLSASDNSLEASNTAVNDSQNQITVPTN